MAKRRLSQVELAGQRVLVRVDFNVPIEEQGVAAIAQYDQRLRATLPTIRHLIGQGCRVILCSHLGRPGGKVVEALRLRPVGDRLAALLQHPVNSLPVVAGPEAEAAVAAMQPGEVALLENLRFDPGEEKNAPEFAQSLAALADFFIMDAFAVAHRAHASTAGITAFLPSAMGLLVEREITAMGQALAAPEKPLAALMGGAKVSDKILVLENLLEQLDHLFIGGGMCVTFLRAQGYATGASRIEEDRLEFAREVLQRAAAAQLRVHLPDEVVVASEFAPDPAQTQTVAVGQVPDGWHIMDIAPSAAAAFVQSLQQCRTIIWNGPMGVFEMPRFSAGTRTVAEGLAAVSRPPAPESGGPVEGSGAVTSVVGGGSTAEAVEALGLMERMTHTSTGGGASLEFLGGLELPGIAALPDA